MKVHTIGGLLAGCGLDRLDAHLLLEQASGLSRTRQITWPEQEVPEETAQRFLALAARRLAGEPVAYLLGVREFFGRDFRVTPDTLIPRPETEHLVEFALAHLPPAGRMLDLGTGSGAIAVTVACERPDARVTALDVSAAALAVARSNGQHLQAQVRWLESDWFSALPVEERFELIVSNPPYIAAGDPHLEQGDLRFEPASALTDFADGLEALQVLATQACRFVTPGGWLAVEHGYDQGKACRALFAGAGWQSVSTLPDLAGLDRVTVGQWMATTAV